MKIIAVLFFSLLLAKGCNKEAAQDMASAEITYTTLTRGFYQKTKIQDQKIYINRDRDGQMPKEGNLVSDADWKELIGYFNETDLEKLPELKAPTEKRFYDGAAIANLEVVYKGKTYASTAFDHGHPPAEIEKLVNKIAALARPEK